MKSGILIPREPAVDLVKILSEGTYTSLPQALKEFVSNAYDADATRVDISVDEDRGSLVVRDNGVGMSLQDFRDYFASIARPGKSGARSVHGRTNLGRPKIGRFGIGSLAILGTARHFSVRSVKKSIGEGFEASIDLSHLRKHFEKGEDLSNHWRFAFSHWSGESTRTHFTEIRIEGIRDDIRSILSRPGSKMTGEFHTSVKKLSGIDELAWRLGVICPVSYLGGYPFDKNYLDSKRDRLLISRMRKILRDNFSVFLNGRPIRRDVSIPRYDPRKLTDQVESALLRQRGLGFEVIGIKSRRRSPVYFDGYLGVQATQLFPQELRGIQIRLRGVGIGWHGTLTLGATGLSTMLTNMTGEIWVEGLEEALQFDRESFRDDHPKFVALRNQIEHIIRAEATRFRARSKVRTAQLRKLRPRRKGKQGKRRTRIVLSVPSPQGTVSTVVAPSVVGPAPAAPTDAYITEEIFDQMPDYITRLIPQVNGCWERGYYEACAMVIRRLIETLIIHLYHSRGWDQKVRNPVSGEYFMLKALINKVCGDQRVKLEKRVQDGLKDLKKLGDVATHDFKIHVRKHDLEKYRSELRYTSERLIFVTRGTGS